MTPNQEDHLYEFLENVTEPFTLEDVTAFIRMVEPKRGGRLSFEVASLIDSRNIAFRLDSRHWVSRRGCFESVPFVINPTRLELLNGILIPGHRCLPFANPGLLPQEYVFRWKGKAIPASTTEGPPDEFYPYFSIFGEEYAPQYVARDNPENEAAYNSDPFDDPPEVSIKTLDMRSVYRESSFVPGDRFVVRTADWREGIFDLEKVAKDAWSQTELYAWFEAAEGGFEDSFALFGPGGSTEEQIAYAYWYGGKRMRDVPAYSLEDFLYDKTDRIETAGYGIETRFWYAGKEIPDNKKIEGFQALPDRTVVEEILYRRHIPISEYVIQSYVRDALFRSDEEIPNIIQRIVPPVVPLEEPERDFLGDYITDALNEYRPSYSVFADKGMGPVRQRVGELHTAVIELTARLLKGDIDSSWLPKHTYIVLSQIQSHAAGLLEDLDIDKEPPPEELEAMDNSLDSMIETYEDIKELIDDALDSFRRNNLSVVKNLSTDREQFKQTVQISVGGIDVWRRVIIPASYHLEELHVVIQSVLGWKNSYQHRFSIEEPNSVSDGKLLDEGLRISELGKQGITELIYEYGNKWTVKVLLLSRADQDADDKLRCVAGAGAGPPEVIEGPLRYRKMLYSLEQGGDNERRMAQHELGPGFKPDIFDLDACNNHLRKTGFGSIRIDHKDH
jgi:hypothetical protein